jgi:hypothetical protein
MKAKQWNATMFSAMIALAVIAVPFFAIAGDIDFGGFSDVDFGGVSDVDFGGFSDVDFGGVSDIDFGGFTDIGFGGASGTDATGDAGTGLGGTGSTGGFDPFDDDLGPFDDIPGNPPGDDIEQPPVVTPVIPPVIPVTPVTPSDSDKSTGDESLKIFIHNIFMNSPFDELPGNQVALRVTFENTGTKKLENVKVIVGIPDLAVRTSFGPMDLGSGHKTTGTVFLELPDYTEDGVYPVRLQVYSEDAQRIVHREIEVVDYS